MAFTLGEFVKQLAASLHREKVRMPFEDERPWHLLFYEFQQANTPGKPEFLDRLRFDWDGPYPKCQELSDFLQALHWNASVSVVNPDYDHIELSADVAALWLRRQEDLEASSRQFLSNAVVAGARLFNRPAEGNVTSSRS